MNNSEDIKIITDSLNKNPMFRLSLGSKELFHSNFLEFLWEQNSDTFLEMLKEIPSKNDDKTRVAEFIDKLTSNGYELQFAREKEHFDLCIFHVEKDAKGRDIETYDIVIENKVKSIPFKAQLDEYVEKIEKEQDVSPIYILLSLAQNFAEREGIEEKWVLCSYNQLATLIRSKYSIFCKYIKDKYIRDYCNFIESLIDLEDYIEKRRDMPKEQYELLRNIRLHDLCIKQRGSFFLGNLYKKIIEAKMDKNIITFGKEDREDTEHKVFLSNSYNNGKCTITASIRVAAETGCAEDSIFYIIQIEGNPFDGRDGNQYRHMVNKINLAKNCKTKVRGKKRMEVDPNKLKSSLTTTNAITFMEFAEPFEVNAQSLSKEQNQDYCKYEPHAVYKYIKFKDSYFDNLLDIMAKDVINTYKILIKK